MHSACNSGQYWSSVQWNFSIKFGWILFSAWISSVTSLFCQLLASLFTLVCLPVSDVLIDRYFSLELYQDYCNSLLTAAVLVYFHLIQSVESIAACLVYRAHCSDCSMQVSLASSILFSSLLSCYLVADPSSDLSATSIHGRQPLYSMASVTHWHFVPGLPQSSILCDTFIEAVGECEWVSELKNMEQSADRTFELLIWLQNNSRFVLRWTVFGSIFDVAAVRLGIVVWCFAIVRGEFQVYSILCNARHWWWLWLLWQMHVST